MAIRPSNTVTMIRKQIEHAEAGTPGVMELVSLVDEIKRQERKWREFEKAGISRRVNPSDYTELETWYARVGNVMGRVERTLPGDASPAERALLLDAMMQCSSSSRATK